MNKISNHSISQNHSVIDHTRSSENNVLSQMDRKVGRVSLNIFNSHLAALFGKSTVLSGIGLAMTKAFSAFVIPTTLIMSAGSLTSIAMTFISVPIIAIVAGTIISAVMIVEIIRKNKKLKYEISLLYTMASGGKDWWTPINDKIILGAIPLGSAHADRLQKAGVGAVLTMLEDFEMEKGLVEPVSSKEWKERDIEHHHIQTVDFMGVPPEQIQEGVEFLEAKIKEGKKVYVHCKAGRGRSVTVVIAHLLKQEYMGQNVDFEKAYNEIYDQVKKQRLQINLNPKQKQAIENYYNQYVKNPKVS
jgi:protein-tyrosine phosphatase